MKFSLYCKTFLPFVADSDYFGIICYRTVVNHTASAIRTHNADSVKIELNTGISPAIIVPVDGSDNFLYMVLPVRLKAN